MWAIFFDHPVWGIFFEHPVCIVNRINDSIGEQNDKMMTDDIGTLVSPHKSISLEKLDPE